MYPPSLRALALHDDHGGDEPAVADAATGVGSHGFL